MIDSQNLQSWKDLRDHVDQMDFKHEETEAQGN